MHLVPSAPADIKAIPASNTKVIVSWLPPLNMNGEIVSGAIVYSCNIIMHALSYTLSDRVARACACAFVSACVRFPLLLLSGCFYLLLNNRWSYPWGKIS